MKGKVSCLILLLFSATYFGLWMKSAHAGCFMGAVLGLMSAMAIRMYEDRNKT